jgi:hypothetical protein
MKAINFGNPLNLPELPIEEKEKNIIKSIFCKNKEWEYEKEIRYVKKIGKTDVPFEYGWKIEELYLGYKYLDNTDEKLEELIEIINLCLDKGIKIFTMDYLYDKEKKEMLLKKMDWIKSEHILERENYDRIIRSIKRELLERLKKSNKGVILEEFIKQTSQEIVKKSIDKMLLDARMKML